MNEKPSIIKLKPVLKTVVWGGSRLATDFHYVPDGDHLGECWGISAHPNGDCEIEGGQFHGMKLSALYAQRRDLFGNFDSPVYPLLVKIIDARDKLSIQVHPDDAYAAQYENGSLGKTECWYIMDCPEGAELVIGHKAKTREELREMVHRGRYMDLIRRVPVKKGDFVQIEPGTIHAITEGMLILETQQSSDLTYRVYDYDRLVDGKKRPIHVEQSIAVTNVPDEADRKGLIHGADLPENALCKLVECAFYTVWKCSLDGECHINQEYPFLQISVLEGEGKIDHSDVKKGDHLILPAGYGKAVFRGRMELILSAPV